MFRVLLFLLILVFIILFSIPIVRAQEIEHTPTPQGTLSLISPVISITNPLPGQIVQGIVSIRGSSALKNFVAAELTFAYENNPTNTWFIIQPQVSPIVNGPLGEWDTTTITDGVYTLRLTVFLTDGEQKTATVAGLRVNNYTPIESSQYSSTFPTASPSIVTTPMDTLSVTSTALPTNPVYIAKQDVQKSLGIGVLVAIGIFSFLGLIITIRSKRYRY